MSSQPSVRSTAIEILNSFNNNYRNYEQRIYSFAKNRSFSPRDKNYLYKLVNGVIIYQKLLDFIINLTYNRSIKRLESPALNLLRLGIYQKVILNTPDHASIYETVEAAKKVNRKDLTGLVNGVLRNLPDREKWQKELEKYEPIKKLAIEYSHPDWLVKKWINEFGHSNTEKILEFNNNYTKIFFRHNSLDISWSQLKKKLEKRYKQIESYKLNNIHLFSVSNPGQIINSEIVKNSWVIIQDYSQIFPVLLLNPQTRENILDACAAPGGKTSLIAQLTDNHAQITATDISHDRIDRLEQNLESAKTDGVTVKVADATRDNYPNFNKILLDVPCSGTGVIARRADLRWNRQPSDIQQYTGKQLKMLYNMAKYIDDRGTIVYSTCSMEEEENWGVVEEFLNKKNFKVDDARNFVDEKYCDEKGAVNIKPFRHKLTGSFAVRLIKDK